jgi:crotonobetainyl-CoA:carnitine CoA-transferase CaiB-like acyl-CoA transferase
MTSAAALSALSHLRVLDLTRARAGPTCCRYRRTDGRSIAYTAEGFDSDTGGCEHTEQVLRELEYGDADIQRLRDAKIV